MIFLVLKYSSKSKLFIQLFDYLIVNMPKYRSVRRPKRKFSGNQHTESPKVAKKDAVETRAHGENKESLSSSRRSISSKKVNLEEPKQSKSSDKQSVNTSVSGYRLIDLEILSELLSSLRCNECNNFSITLIENRFQRKGCASNLNIFCGECGWNNEFFTSKKQTKSFEVNRRLIYSMRALGKGHSGAKKFCTLMNMPPPPSARAYSKNSKTISKHVKTIANKTMSSAASEIKNLKSTAENDIVDCAVSCDGTWQKRGFSSKNGCITVISMDNGKVLDTEALSQSCKQCQQHSHLNKDSIAYRTWWAAHSYKCSANYQGSAPGMESEGAGRLFGRSLEKHSLRYTELYADGDSKSHSEIEHAYEDVVVEKKECVGHVQKRVGTALRKLKKGNTGMGGKGKLTDAMIDKLQNYYGIAIRSNVNDLNGMKKSIHATLFHCASNNNRPLHDHCPSGASSWCGYKRDQANKTKTYKHGAGLPLDIIAKIKPIYIRLSSDELLKKCLHGKTQNQNEAFNGLVWQRVPKEVFVGRSLLEFGLYDAVAHFNQGSVTVLELYKSLNIEPGLYTEAGCRVLDNERVYGAEYKENDTRKRRRKVLRGQRKKKEDKKQQVEGPSYSAGSF